jgi:phosphoserine phosphatase
MAIVDHISTNAVRRSSRLALPPNRNGVASAMIQQVSKPGSATSVNSSGSAVCVTARIMHTAGIDSEMANQVSCSRTKAGIGVLQPE